MPRAFISLLFSITESLLVRFNRSSLYTECLNCSGFLIIRLNYKIVKFRVIIKKDSF